MPSFGLTSSSVGMAFSLTPSLLSLCVCVCVCACLYIYIYTFTPLVFSFFLSLLSLSLILYFSFTAVHFASSPSTCFYYVAFPELTSNLSEEKKEGCWLDGSGVGSPPPLASRFPNLSPSRSVPLLQPLREERGGEAAIRKYHRRVAQRRKGNPRTIRTFLSFLKALCCTPTGTISFRAFHETFLRIIDC